MSINCVGYTQAEVVQKICQAYLKPGSLILDCTWGEGLFWSWMWKLFGYKVIGSDLTPQKGCILKASFLALPFDNHTFDACFFDPPYANPTRETDPLPNRKHFHTTRGGMCRELLYAYGALECLRAAKHKALLAIKSSPGSGCDEIWLRTLLKPFAQWERNFILISGNIRVRPKLESVYSGHDTFHIFWKRSRQGI